MQFIKVSLIIMFMSLGLTSFAESSASSGEAEAKSEGAASSDSKLNKEYQNKLSQLKMYKGKMDEDDNGLRHLVALKNQEKDKAKQSDYMKQMVDLVNQRNKTADKFNKLKAELELRYPSKGQDLNRSYQTQSKKTIEDLEGSASLDDMLTRTKKMIDKKFAPFMPPKPKVATSPKEDSDFVEVPEKKEEIQPSAEKPKRIRLER